MRPLIALMAIQAVMTMGVYSLPVVIPVAAPGLGMQPESVGFLIALVYFLGMTTGLFSGVVLNTLGATRVFQGLLSMTVIGIVLLALSMPYVAVLTAIILGIAAGPMNPSGSYVLAPVVPTQHRSFIFSIKQCATPAGGMLAGALLPPLMIIFGWQTAMLLIPLLSLILIFIAPLGQLGARPQHIPRKESPVHHIRRSIKLVLLDPAIRGVTFAGVALAIGQMGSATYLVVYLWREVGFSEAAAGLVFAVLHLSGIGARLVLGFLADRFVSARWTLVGVSLVLAASLIVIGQFDENWPRSVIYLVTVLAGASGNGWVGLYFAELARLSPQDKIAEVAGGSQFFTYAGLVLGPLLCGALLRLSDSYVLMFSVLAAIALGAAIGLTRSKTS